MRIVIDMQGAQTESRFRGIGRYSLSLAQAIVRHAGQHEVYLALNGQLTDSIDGIRAAFNSILKSDHIRVFDIPLLQNVESWSNLSAEIIREDFLASLKPDVVILTSVFEGHWAHAVTSIGLHAKSFKTAAVLYDLIPLIHADQYLLDADLKVYYNRKLKWIKQADLLLAISDSSRKEGIDHLQLDPEKVVNISTAIGPEFKPPSLNAEKIQAILAKFKIHRKMVLYAPGGFDPRKNFDRLISAYSQLAENLRAEHQLVIVSKLSPSQRAELNAMAKLHGLRDDELVLTGYVDDEELIALYALTQLFVFPSLHEGFGLPALEAMACGAPVVGSGTTSLPEVIGLSEALFDPESTASMAQTMARALTDEVFLQRLRSHGASHVHQFSWDQSAKTAIQALERLHLEAPPVHSCKTDLLKALAQTAIDTKPSPAALKEVARAIAFNQGGPRRQLLLDISTLVQSDAKSGIQRVVRSLVSELFKQDMGHMVVQPIYFEHGAYRYANAFCEERFSQTTGVGDATVDFFQDDVYLSLDLNMHLSKQTHHLHQNLRHRGLRVAYVVYDILLAQQPQWWTPENGTLFLTWLRNIGEVATDLVCISQAVAEDTAQWFLNHPLRRRDGGPALCHFHLGADVGSSLPSQGVPKSAGDTLSALKDRISFLMVGTVEPRKGYAQTLAAFELLWDKGLDINLVIVGKRGWLVDTLVDKLSKHPEKHHRLHWLEGISDEYLEKLYEACDGLIAASEGEGFGLPLIEAAQHGLDLIARDLPVFREVASDSAYYFRGLAPEHLADAVLAWLALYEQKRQPSTENMRWLTWRESAEQLIKNMKLN
ncbi:glycosyl transferase family 1 [Limnohabitans sp. 2KL-1]|uniref:glycosyltransferase family 4 protein n=1 Tax=Limnohabitans sp. 2KL-1 TaxID=1100699 RepID=UPI000D37472E|nr:glycosyltransferase family 1 protein [Limnohabitans sp. 2KL-1]PUE50657.1 glycosyl transferase family 1 [Limnohabitans sp. 2KL-1]